VFLTLALCVSSGQLHALATLPPRERTEPQYPLDRRLSGDQSQSGCGGKEKKSLPLLGSKSHLSSP